MTHVNAFDRYASWPINVRNRPKIDLEPGLQVIARRVSGTVTDSASMHMLSYALVHSTPAAWHFLWKPHYGIEQRWWLSWSRVKTPTQTLTAGATEQDIPSGCSDDKMQAPFQHMCIPEKSTDFLDSSNTSPVTNLSSALSIYTWNSYRGRASYPYGLSGTFLAQSLVPRMLSVVKVIPHGSQRHAGTVSSNRTPSSRFAVII